MKTPTDPTLARIRRVRHEISAECGHDPYKLVEYYIGLQEQHRERLVDTGGSATAGKSAA
ncbi:MAG: hypothetical protein ACJ8J0_00960 [Longimicrobiaceae bacterium]